MAGYSGTPLPQKLGIKPGSRLAFVNAPHSFATALGPLPPDVTVATRAAGTIDVAVLFATSKKDLEQRLPPLQGALDPAGGIWVAWPKKTSGVQTDMTEDSVRDVGLPRGLVDNKVCAIDETWSALRLVIRRENRPVFPIVPRPPGEPGPLDAGVARGLPAGPAAAAAKKRAGAEKAAPRAGQPKGAKKAGPAKRPVSTKRAGPVKRAAAKPARAAKKPAAKRPAPAKRSAPAKRGAPSKGARPSKRR